MSAPTRLRLFALPALGAALLATVLGGSPASAAGATRPEQIEHARRIAVNQIGDPYHYGSAGPARFDCSGLVYYSFRKAGLAVPRTSQQQANSTRHIRKRNLRRGDLMFFHDGGGVYHDAIFLGWNRSGRAVMLHSPNSGEHVRREVTWTRSWYAGTLRRG